MLRGPFPFLSVLIAITAVVVSEDAEPGLDLEQLGFEHSFAELIESQYILEDFAVEDCTPNRPMVIAIKSAPDHFELRDALRQLWLRDARRLDIQHFFMLGDPRNETTMSLMIEESDKYHDLVVGKFVDHYYNLTIKTLFTLNWIKLNCPRTWLLSTDDDSMIKVHDFLTIVAVETRQRNLRTIFGYGLDKYPLVNRRQLSKWFMPRSVYPADRYPSYVTGRGVLLPPEAVIDLYFKAFDEKARPRLKIDDVFIYGIVRELANVTVNCSLRSKSLWQCPAAMTKTNDLLKCLNYNTVFADTDKLMLELAKPQKSRIRHKITSRSKNSIFASPKCP